MADMELYRLLGQNVARLRNDSGRTQAEIAAQIGLTRASLANIETGRQKVLMHHVFRLANALCPSASCSLTTTSRSASMAAR